VIAGTHTVAETAGNNTSLSNYSGAINCTDFTLTSPAIRAKIFSTSVDVPAGHDIRCTITNTVIPPPDLTKSFSPTTINSGASTVLTFTVSNGAGTPARTVSFIDTLPSGLAVANITVGGTCSNAAAATLVVTGGSTITVSNLNVPAGPASCTVTVNVTNMPSQTNASCSGNPAAFTNSAANISGAASVSTSTMVPSCLVVSSIADLAITKSTSLANYKPGIVTPEVYTVVVTNNGPDNVTGASFTDTAPAGVTFGSWTCTITGTGTCPGPGSGDIVNALLNLNAGSSATFVINATIGASATGNITNTASESLPAGVTQDPNNITPNQASTTVPVQKVAGKPETIPTLTTWMLIVMASLLGLVAVAYLRRRGR
jgi:uncharacterized repeat protein (TIGR01451 family)